MGTGSLGSGLEQSTRSLFQQLCFLKWRNNRKIILQNWEFFQPVDGRRYEIDKEHPRKPLELDWDDIHGLTDTYLTPALPPNMFCYKQNVHVGLPVMDAFLVRKGNTYLFQLTTSNTHDIVMDKWKEVITKIRKVSRDVSWIMVNPEEFDNNNPQLRSNMEDYRKDYPDMNIRFLYARAERIS